MPTDGCQWALFFVSKDYKQVKISFKPSSVLKTIWSSLHKQSKTKYIPLSILPYNCPKALWLDCTRRGQE